MIKVLVSDMDGTLCEGHGKTIFNLSPNNEIALQKIKDSSIHFYIASGRMSCYGTKMLKDHGFCDLIASGFNGADVYDNGNYPIRYTLDAAIIHAILALIQEKNYPYHFMQIQTLDAKRIFNDTSLEVVNKYRLQNKLFHIDQVLEIDIPTFLKEYPTNMIGKLSIVLNDSDTANKVFQDIESFIHDTCFVTMSNSLTIEICNKHANKGVFIQYLINTYHYHKDEIAVIGDALNDSEMFPYATHTFAMASGKEAVKQKAKYVVHDVAECIDICLQYNESHKGL